MLSPLIRDFFLCISACATYAAFVNPNDIKTLSANELSTFFFKDKPVFSNGLRILPKNPPDCFILDS